jgi:hypothetical protein
MPLGGHLGCSSTTTVGPTWRFPSRRDGVCPSASLYVVDHFKARVWLSGGRCGQRLSPLSSFVSSELAVLMTHSDQPVSVSEW